MNLEVNESKKFYVTYIFNSINRMFFLVLSLNKKQTQKTLCECIYISFVTLITFNNSSWKNLYMCISFFSDPKDIRFYKT